MLKVKVKDNDLETAIKMFMKFSKEIETEYHKHDYWIRPSLKRKLKSKEAQRRLAKEQAKLNKYLKWKKKYEKEK